MHLLTELLDVLRRLIVAEACAVKLQVTELLEAEARALRSGIYRAVVACLMALAALAAVGVGIVLALWGLYVLLAPVVGAAGAAFLVAAILAVIAVNLLVFAHWLLHRKKR